MNKNQQFSINESNKENKSFLTIDDYFQHKMFLDMIKNSRKKNSKKKYKSYHARLLEKSLDAGLSRGKMSKFCEYNAYNSDDDSSEQSDNYEDNLFYRYGLASRVIDTSIKFPKWSQKSLRSKVLNSKLNAKTNQQDENG